MDRNNKLLREFLDKLRLKPLYSSIEINTIGIRFHLLKDSNNQIYSLVIPNKPLNDTEVLLMKESGFNEKFRRINFDRFYNQSSTEEIINTTSHILKHVLKVSDDKLWRIDIATGMKLLKYNESEIPNSIRIQKQKIESNKLLYKMLRKYGINVIVSIIFSIFFGLSIMNEKSLSIEKTVGLILLLTFLLSFFLTQIENVRKWRWKRKYNR